MNLAEILSGLLRRWYITFPGIVLAIAAAVGAWTVVPVEYERTATQFLLPGEASMPENSNPFLYLGGLSYATDVVVRALGSENVMNEIAEKYPGVEVEVARDATTSGPVVLTTVTASDDQLAGQVLDEIVGKTEGVLADLQDIEAIAADNRISVVNLTVDDLGQLQQRNRLVATVGVGVGIAVLFVVTAGLVDGLARQRRRRAGEEDPADEREQDDDSLSGLDGDDDDVDAPEPSDDDEFAPGDDDDGLGIFDRPDAGAAEDDVFDDGSSAEYPPSPVTVPDRSGEDEQADGANDSVRRSVRRSQSSGARRRESPSP